MASARKGEPPKPRILLVEDDADTAEAMELSLQSAGYSVTTASTAKQALEMELADVDLVVSDIGLPDMTGHDLLRELREKRVIPAICLSGYGTERDIRSSRSAGFSAHLTKPVDLGTLIEAVQKAMQARYHGV